MSSLATLFEFSTAKNCFLSIKHGRKKQERREGAKILVYEAELKSGKCVYLSLPGDGGEIRSGDAIALNGLYAEKLGIRDNQQMVVKPVTQPPATARQVNVEPLTVDDWEILERSAGQIESGLLDQIRVVWPGQVIPVWVEKSICIFITVASVEPCASFAVLDTNTTVVVAPKTRLQQNESTNRPPALKMPARQNAQDMTDKTPSYVGKSTPPFSKPGPPKSPNLQPTDGSPRRIYRKPERSRNKRNSHSDPSQSSDLKKPPLNRSNTESLGKSMLMELVSSFWNYQGQKHIGFAEPSDDELEEATQEVDVVSPDNLVYRIQASNFSSLYDNLKAALERQAYEDDVDGNDVHAPAELLQPTTIYVTAKDSSGERLGGFDWTSAPRVYFAELRKLPSAQDREKAQAEARKPKEKGKEQLQQQPPPDDDSQLRCVVRVVTVDRSAAGTSSPWQYPALAVQGELGLVDGHAILPTELRRQLKLDATGSAWVKVGGVTFAPLGTIILYPISIVPRAIDNKMLGSAFRQWVEIVADEDHPLVLFHGMLVRFKVSVSVHVEAQLLLGGGQGSASLLTRSKVRTATVIVQRDNREDIPLPAVVTPMLAYRGVDDLDPKPPPDRLDQLGGVSGLTKAALRHMEACLGSRPLPRKLFCDRPGLNHGLLLLTGPKGSGKSCLAAALCNTVSRSPTLAHTFIVDCKPLRGKRVETIQSLLEAAFDEAAWRQPAVICLDDLDVIAPAPDNPAAEMSGEALYAAKVSEVLEGLVKFEMRNFSRLAMILTSQSRSTLHPSLVASRGFHFVQEVTAIKPPDKAGRKELVLSILETHSTVRGKTTLERLDMDTLVSRMEGYVARDIQTLVNRALHFHLARNPTEGKTVTLLQDDFDTALEGFKPVAIRNVALHTAGDTGWSDVGGLEDVKVALVETLLWPSKYPELFANCPLRLRSGLLLYGPPGTGKTMLAGAVARECSLNFISIKGPELLSKYIGASEQAVRDLFVRAQSAKPCVLFFDEFDSIAPKRGHDSTGVTDRVVNQLLTQLDGVEGLQGVYMLGATSRPDLIDPALLRPGRLDKCLYCNLPSQEERRSILQALTGKMMLGDDVELDDIADMCEFFTGADFKALLYNAQLQAIHEFTDAEKVLGDSLVRIRGSPDTCSMVTKSPITIKAKNSPLSSGPASPVRSQVCGEIIEEDGKIAMAVTSANNPMMPQPGPGGDAPECVESQMEAKESSRTRCAPPNHLEIPDGVDRLGQHKGKTVTFFPKMGDAPAILTPEDEARFLNMVETIHRRQGQFVPRTNLERRRASSVLVKPNVMVPVGQRHLLAAAKSMKPSVSATERLRYQVIYHNFVSGRQGDFQTGNQQAGMRTTLA
ncbi:peroxisomal ATPase PEX1-like [Littorina saxatilis]|uniref:peroxisomal ATPase PEX1-like n=1 Tax=Littorina saxatilis TaxID=31220 RepID=UPI0038B47775